MAPELRKYIWDAEEAASRVLRFTAGKTLDDYLNDELLRSAVERQFLILGEALGKVRQLDSGRRAPDYLRLAPQFCDWRTLVNATHRSPRAEHGRYLSVEPR